jgi:alpha-mannosidase
MGYAAQAPIKSSDDAVSVRETGDGFVLENASVRARLDDQGRLVDFYDKRCRRETIVKGSRGNQFTLFEDRPNSYDAWNVEIYHLGKRREVGTPLKAEITHQGRLLGCITFNCALTDRSTLTQRVSLRAHSGRLDFDCEADWHETDQMLKVEFPLDVHSDHATYEIQFGHLRRPTHFNTSWDVARFEVPAQRWADLSEPAFGVALLNDSKYGYSCHGKIMRLSLLRSPTWPDPKADQGRHGFRYALYPHAGSPQTGGVVREAMRFNQPLLAVATDAAPVSHSFFAVDNEAIVIDTVKKAEDSDDLIVRLYESSGSRQTGTLTSALTIKSATPVNLLEDAIGKAPWQRGLTLTLRPFQIASYRLRLE